MKRNATSPARNSSNLLTIAKMGMTKAQVARLNFKAMNAFVRADANIKPAHMKPSMMATSGTTVWAMAGK